jgi:glucan biosynthesis protein C
MSIARNGEKSRIHHWDFSRAFYLLLGLPFHATLAYSIGGEWVINSSDESLFLTLLADIIHIFRMPGFFFLAGFFSIMILMRGDTFGWLKSRLTRLAIPLISATILILPGQMIFEAAALSYNETGTWDETATHFSALITSFGEPWVSHLWFLWSLIAYTIALGMIHFALGAQRVHSMINWLVDWAMKHRLIAFSIFVAGCILAAAIEQVIVMLSPKYGDTLVSYNAYFIYFAAGIVLFCSQKLQDMLIQPSLNRFSLGITLAAISQFAPANLMTHTLQVVTGVIGAFLIVASISSWAARYYAKPNKHINKLVDASFTIYLFHHPIIFVLATAFLTVSLPPIVEFLAITIGAGLGAYAIHWLITKSNTLTLMFNGAVKKPATGIERVIRPSSRAVS